MMLRRMAVAVAVAKGCFGRLQMIFIQPKYRYSFIFGKSTHENQFACVSINSVKAPALMTLRHN